MRCGAVCVWVCVSFILIPTSSPHTPPPQQACLLAITVRFNFSSPAAFINKPVDSTAYETLLHLATHQNWLPAVKVLLKHGADANLTSKGA